MNILIENIYSFLANNPCTKSLKIKSNVDANMLASELGNRFNVKADRGFINIQIKR